MSLVLSVWMYFLRSNITSHDVGMVIYHVTHEDLIKRAIFRSAKYVINHASLVNSVACIEKIILLITVQQSNGQLEHSPSTISDKSALDSSYIWCLWLKQ